MPENCPTNTAFGLYISYEAIATSIPFKLLFTPLNHPLGSHNHESSFQGIDRERVERMEARLKEDILREAERYRGAIMVIHETDNGQIYDTWEHVSSESVQTPFEVFKRLECDGFPIKYARVPITDGKAPKSSDFDALALNIVSASKDTAFVFNCQVEVSTLLTLPERQLVDQRILIIISFLFLLLLFNLCFVLLDGYRKNNHWNCNCLPIKTSDGLWKAY